MDLRQTEGRRFRGGSAAVAADLTISRAIPPYNEVLGGKLLAVLMMSPEWKQEA